MHANGRPGTKGATVDPVRQAHLERLERLRLLGGDGALAAYADAVRARGLRAPALALELSAERLSVAERASAAAALDAAHELLDAVLCGACRARTAARRRLLELEASPRVLALVAA